LWDININYFLRLHTSDTRRKLLGQIGEFYFCAMAGFAASHLQQIFRYIKICVSFSDLVNRFKRFHKPDDFASGCLV
jgi:hypothetical protein